MSLPALGPTEAARASSAGPADAAAAAQRVQELQEMMARAQRGPAPSSFADALSSASASAAATPSAAASAATPSAASAFAAPPGSTPAPATATGGTQATPYDGAIAQAAARHNLDPALLHGLIQQESGFDPNARSSAGALGLTQLMPGTAASLGVSNPLDPVQSIEGGARYLSQMLAEFGGNTADALAAYNAGPGAVRQYGGVPPYAETESYVNKVLGYAAAYRQGSIA